jgi:hypothetical protein
VIARIAPGDDGTDRIISAQPDNAGELKGSRRYCAAMGIGRDIGKAGRIAPPLWRALLFACLIVALPRLLPTAWQESLDAASASTPAKRQQEPGDSFPGSAYFLAEGALAPTPGIVAGSDPHIVRLDNGPAAPSTLFRGVTAVDRYRAANCLAAAIYYEAGNEPEEGQRAVAQVVLNRVRHPAWPNSVCEVVYQGTDRADLRCQFSFACDGAMARLPNAGIWAQARKIAVAALAGRTFAPVGLSTYYHTLAVSPPWSASLQPVAMIGAHIFYRWKGMAGQPAAFTNRYARLEVQSGPAPRAAISADIVMPAALAPPVDPSPVIAAVEHHPSSLPSSGIRPEYLSSGRPLTQ